MASNWIKVEVITPDKPEIFLISEKLNIDPDMVLGKLIRLWVWADQQIAISNADSVTDTEQMECKSNASLLSKIAIDRIAFMPGFADALIHAGWLIQEDDSLFFVNFERHNGKNSKNRALTNERVNKSRNLKRNSNAKSNAVSVTPADQKALPEEEEEEEEDKKLKDPPIPPKEQPAKNKFDPFSVELPEWLSPALWAEWVEYRKALRKPIKTSQGANGSIRELDKYRGEGIPPEQVIRHSIAREYQGLYPPKDIPASRSGSRDVNAVSQPDNSIPDGFTG